MKKSITKTIVAFCFLAGLSFSANAQDSSNKTDLEKIINENHNELFNDPLSPRIGNEHAPVVIVSFIDYNCTVCRKFDPQLTELLKSNPEIAIVFKPLAFRHPSSGYASEAAISMWQQRPESFLKFHNRLMGKKGAHSFFSVRAAMEYSIAEVIPLQKEDVQKVIKRNERLAEKLGVWGTPATLFGNTLLVGTAPQSELDKAIKILLNNP